MSEPRSYEEQQAELFDAQCIYGIFHIITDECIYVGKTSGKAGSLDVVRWGQHSIACFSKEKYNRDLYIRMREDGLRKYELRVLEESVFPDLLNEDELSVKEQTWCDDLKPSCCMRRAFDSDPIRRQRNKERYAAKKRKQAAARGEGQRPPNTTTLEQYGFRSLKR